MDTLPPRLPDRAHVRACLLTNLLILPGLGSVLAGRRDGWLQMTLALIGFGLTAWWLVTFVLEWVQTAAFPATGGSHLVTGMAGVSLFVVGWCWSLVTGLRLLRRAA